MRVCETAINKLSERKLDPKSKNEIIKQTYYQDKIAFCWSLDDHEPDLNPDNHHVTCSILRLITGTPSGSGTMTLYSCRDTLKEGLAT